MHIYDVYSHKIKYCPVCGQGTFEPHLSNAFLCKSCDFLQFHNVATTAVGILTVGDEILITERARDPKRGYYDLPGGFSEPLEKGHDALSRELKEELTIDVEVTNRHFLCTVNNQYPYRGIDYFTTDLVFHIPLPSKPTIVVADDVSEVHWMEYRDVPLEKMAFPAIAEAIEIFKHEQNNLNEAQVRESYNG